jgi:murein DD-endopeptidase MepM/ murein hydrolase activator NlpD
LKIRKSSRPRASSLGRGFIRTAAVSFATSLLLALGTGSGLAEPPAPAAGPASQDPATLGAQLQTAQAKVSQLNDQIRQNQVKLEELNRTLDADQRRQAELQAQLGDLARIEYEQPTLALSSVLRAPTLSRLLDEIALSRVMVGRQQALLDQVDQLHQRDQAARDETAKEVEQLQAARVEAARAAESALGIRNTVAEILLSQAKPGDPFAGECQPTVEQGFGPSTLGLEPSLLGFLHFHTGIDLSCQEGARIHSVTSGIAHVTHGWGGGFGNNVVVESQGAIPGGGSGASATYFVRYGHMLPDIVVEDGATVHAGDVIGFMGSSGASTGPHLHFEVDVGANDINHAVDPTALLSIG